MRFEDWCIKMTAAGLAFTSIVILPILGGILIWKLATANGYKSDFLIECSREHELEKCSEIWEKTNTF